MKLNVPFFKQTTPLNCGPTALKMALSYLDKEHDIRNLEERTGINKSKGVSTIQIAIAAASLNYKTEFYSKHILLDEKNLELEFYKNYSDVDLEQSKKLVKKAQINGVKINETPLSLKEILSFVKENSVVIILVDWNVIKNKRDKGYQGHFVPIVGYDNGEVYVHNCGLKDGEPFVKIPKEILDEARKAQGTDEDVIVIYGNNQS